MAFVLSNHALFLFLAGYSLHWLPTVLMGVIAASSVVSVVSIFSCVQVLNGLDANLSELQTLLKYQETLRGNLQSADMTEKLDSS